MKIRECDQQTPPSLMGVLPIHFYAPCNQLAKETQRSCSPGPARSPLRVSYPSLNKPSLYLSSVLASSWTSAGVRKCNPAETGLDTFQGSTSSSSSLDGDLQSQEFKHPPFLQPGSLLVSAFFLQWDKNLINGNKNIHNLKVGSYVLFSGRF